MNQGDTVTASPALPAGRRSDAGTVRLTGQDIAGLVLCGEPYGAPYDLLAAFLDVRDDRLRHRGPLARGRVRRHRATWPRAGMVLADPPLPGRRRAAARARRPGPWRTCAPSWPSGWHWRPGTHGRPPGRTGAPSGASAPPWPGVSRPVTFPDAEVSWPDVPGSPYPGERWAIEAELTPKPLARTATIMSALLTRTTGYHPRAAQHPVLLLFPAGASRSPVFLL